MFFWHIGYGCANIGQRKRDMDHKLQFNFWVIIMTKTSFRAVGSLVLLTGLLEAPLSFAQGVGTGALAASSLPVSGSVTLAATVLGLIAIGYWALRKKSHLIVAVAGPVLLAGAGAFLVISPELRADNPLPDFVRLFTNPAGEEIDLRSVFADGQSFFVLMNTSGVRQKIVKIIRPDAEACLAFFQNNDDDFFPGGGPQKPTQLRSEAPGPSMCAVGDMLKSVSLNFEVEPEPEDYCQINFSDYCEGD